VRLEGLGKLKKSTSSGLNKEEIKTGSKNVRKQERRKEKR
jgi:hypothetical protein